MEKASEVRMQMLTEIKRAIQKGKYNVASRYAVEFIKRAYFLQLKKDVFLGEVLEAIYVQINQEINTHAISNEDKSVLNKLMVSNLDELMNAYATNSDVYGALINMRYNATVFQYTTAIKYDYQSRGIRWCIMASNIDLSTQQPMSSFQQKSMDPSGHTAWRFVPPTEVYDKLQSGPPSLGTPDSFRILTQTIYDLQDTVQNMQQEVKTIKEDMQDLLRKLDDKEWEGYGEPEELVEMSVNEIKELILTKMDKSKPFYPSDVADDYNLDYTAVREAVEELISEGRLKE